MINNQLVAIDISGYQINYKLNFNLWADNGIDCVILKGGQGATTETLWNKLYKSYIPIKGMYVWEYPLWDRATQLAFYITELSKYKPDFYAVDEENWWQNYDHYVEAIRKIRPWSEVAKVSSSVLDASCKYLVNGLKNAFPDKLGLLYSGEWYVRSYCPQLNLWINQTPWWPANHPDSWKGIRRVDWNQLLPPVGYSPIYKPGEPGYNTGFSLNSYDLWQHSSTMIIPDENYNLDINISPLSLDQFKVKCGMIVEPKPIITWAEAITEWGRKNPTWPYTGPDPS